VDPGAEPEIHSLRQLLAEVPALRNFIRLKYQEARAELHAARIGARLADSEMAAARELFVNLQNHLRVQVSAVPLEWAMGAGTDPDSDSASPPLQVLRTARKELERIVKEKAAHEYFARMRANGIPNPPSVIEAVRQAPAEDPLEPPPVYGPVDGVPAGASPGDALRCRRCLMHDA